MNSNDLAVPLDAGARTAEPISGALRISDMVAPRKVPPSRGWRRVVHTVSVKTINPGESPAERRYRELSERIRRNVRRQFVVGVLSGKGGVGKTTMAAAIGAVFQECRPDNVIAIDAVPGFGTLAGRIDESPPGDYGALLGDPDIHGYSDIREYLGRNANGLDVLAGNRTASRSRPLTPAMFDAALARVRRTHSVILLDTADDLEHPVMPAVLDACDVVVFVSGLSADTSVPVTRTMDQLRSMGHHDLLSRSVVILNDTNGRHAKEVRGYLSERFGRCGATVEFMPHDPHLAGGGIIDTREALGRKSRLRLFEIAAAIADRYALDATRTPR